MHKTRLSLLIGALLASGICLAEDAKEPAKAAPAVNANIATVNGVGYPVDLFRIFLIERLQENQGQANDQATQQQALNDFMTMVIASQEAEKRKLQDLPDVTAAIAVQRLKVLYNAALAAIARDIQVTDEELKKAYEEVKKARSGAEYKARHILVKDEAEAKKIIKELDKGTDFAELAKKKSDGPNGKNGGELGWFGPNGVAKPFADAVAKLKTGTYTKEPVQTEFGWHVIKLEETRNVEPPKFEDAKPQLTALVQRQKLPQEVKKLVEGALVEFNKELVKTTPKTDAAEATPAPAAAPAIKK